MKYLMIINTIICFALLAIEAPAQNKKAPAKKKSTKTAPATAATPTQVQAPEKAALDAPDLNVRPGPLAGTPWQFPTYSEFTLPNGLHVYVVENHELPTINIGLAIRGGDAYDPVGKEGTAAITGDMLGKGTKQRTAQQIAEALDGVGASISVSTAGESMTVSASGLKKHTNLLLSILSEQLREPVFNEEELSKLKKQYAASIASRRARPVEIGQALSRKVVYGMNNPLARRTSEASVAAVTRDDVSTFHREYIRPNIASIAIVGDVTEKEVRDLLKKYLGSWEKGSRPTVEIPDIKTEPAGVYFVPRKGAVQSTVIVCAAGPPVRAADFLATSVLTDHIGSGFGSVLFATLRETYSYTYSPFSLLTRGRRYNRIAAGAEVRTSVTDSAIAVILKELRKLSAEGPEEDALARRIASEVGQYQLAFERAATVGAVLQNAWINDVPLEEVTTYTERLGRVNAGDVQQAAAEYLNMFNLRIVVVGSPEIRSKLEKFGPIREYTLDLEPAAADAWEPVSMSVSDLIAANVTALGGRAAVDAIQNVATVGTSTMTMQGRELSGTFSRMVARPNKETTVLDLGVMKQQQWTDGTTAWVAMNGGPAAEQSAEEARKIALEARIFPFVSILEDGYKATVKGKRAGQIMIEATSPSGRNERFYLDEKTNLLVRFEKDEDTPRGPITTVEQYDEYTEVSGVKFPGVLVVSNSIFSISTRLSHSVNKMQADDVFVPKK